MAVTNRIAKHAINHEATLHGRILSRAEQSARKTNSTSLQCDIVLVMWSGILRREDSVTTSVMSRKNQLKLTIYKAVLYSVKQVPQIYSMKQMQNF